MRREYQERFPRHRCQRKPLVSDSGMHHGTRVTHVSRCTSESLTRGGGENVPGISGACGTHSFTYLARGPLRPVEDVGITTSSGGENVPGIPGACATRNFTYLVRGPCEWKKITVAITACLFQSMIPQRASSHLRMCRVYVISSPMLVSSSASATQLTGDYRDICTCTKTMIYLNYCVIKLITDDI